MSRLTPSIPQPLAGSDPALRPLKEIVETITGRRPGLPTIEPLPTTATLADVVAKINELIARIQR